MLGSEGWILHGFSRRVKQGPIPSVDPNHLFSGFGWHGRVALHYLPFSVWRRALISARAGKGNLETWVVFFLVDNWTDCMRLSFPAVLPGQQAELFLTIHCLQSGCKWPEFLTGDSNGVHFFFRLCTPWLWQEWLYRMLSAGLWPQLDCWKAIWGSLKWDLFGHCLVLTFKMFCWFLHHYQNGRK